MPSPVTLLALVTASLCAATLALPYRAQTLEDSWHGPPGNCDPNAKPPQLCPGARKLCSYIGSYNMYIH